MALFATGMTFLVGKILLVIIAFFCPAFSRSSRTLFLLLLANVVPWDATGAVASMLNLLYEYTLGKPTIGQLANNQ